MLVSFVVDDLTETQKFDLLIRYNGKVSQRDIAVFDDEEPEEVIEDTIEIDLSEVSQTEETVLYFIENFHNAFTSWYGVFSLFYYSSNQYFNTHISEMKFPLTIKIIEAFDNNFDIVIGNFVFWKYVNYSYKLNMEIINTYMRREDCALVDYINSALCDNDLTWLHIPLSFYEEYYDLLDKKIIFTKAPLTEEFIIKHQKDLKLSYIFNPRCVMSVQSLYNKMVDENTMPEHILVALNNLENHYSKRGK
jgi:hypothetical protein